MFLFRADTYLEALQRFAPAIRECVATAVADARRDLDFLRLDQTAFAAQPGKLDRLRGHGKDRARG
jgi:mannose-1-phosphate guanylyltransferase